MSRIIGVTVGTSMNPDKIFNQAALDTINAKLDKILSDQSGEAPNLDGIDVTPTKDKQNITAASKGLDGFDEVIVNPIPNEYIVPSGSVTLTENNKTYDVTDKANVKVNVPTGSGIDTSELTATASQVLMGKEFYGLSGRDTGSMEDNGYTDESSAIYLSSKYPSLPLNGAYRGKAEIEYDEDRTVTENGTYHVVGDITVAVERGTDTSDATATADKVLYGEVFYGANGRDTGKIALEELIEERAITKNGTYEAPNGKVISKFTVAVPDKTVDEWDGTDVVIAPSTEPYITINGTRYKTDEEMTWDQWVDSSYSPDSYSCDGNDSRVNPTGDTYVVDGDGNAVLGKDVIIVGGAYSIKQTTFNFTIGDKVCSAEAGMTWLEWVRSNYSFDSYSCTGDDSYVMPYHNYKVVDSNGNAVLGKELITVGGVYSVEEEITINAFTVDGTSYDFEEGMTWYEWVRSNYSPDSYSCASTESQVNPTGDTYVVDSNGNAAYGRDLIVVGGVYSVDESYITINGTRYKTEEGMTWYAWVQSKYAPDSYSCSSTESKVKPTGDTYIVDSNGNTVCGKDLITFGGAYTIKEASFSFQVGEKTYIAEAEATWYEWVKSNYAPDSYTCSSTDSKVKPTGDTYVVNSNGNAVLGKDRITVGGAYSIAEEETTKTFTISGKRYDFEEGMSWYEWVRSNYAPDSYSCASADSRVKPTGDTYIVDRDGDEVLGKELIVEGDEYSIKEGA